MRTYLKAFEVARILLEHPNMKVGIKSDGEYKHVPVNSITVREWDGDDYGALITSDEWGRWLLLDSIDDIENIENIEN